MFNVIGILGWVEIERIKSLYWREYLRSFSGRVGLLDIFFYYGVDVDVCDLFCCMF